MNLQHIKDWCAREEAEAEAQGLNPAFAVTTIRAFVANLEDKEEELTQLRAALEQSQAECKQLEEKYISPRKPVSVCDCKHWDRHFIQGGGGTTGKSYHREGVTLCKKCGRFAAFVEKDGVQFTHSFALCSPEMVQAAGQWMRLLEQDAEEDTRAALEAQKEPETRS